MQKVVNLRLHAQQIVKNQTKKRRSAVNMGLCQGFNLLLSIGIMLFSLQGAHAQEAKKISINIKEASIKSALTKVQKISGVKFSYGQDISKYADIKVNYDGKDKSVDEVVAQILKPTNLHAVKMDGYLVIEEKPASQTPTSPNAAAGQETGSLKGRIVEFETSQPLPGASVSIVGTSIGGQSDERGYYTLTGIPAGNQTLDVSFIGYQTERISVNVNANREATYDVRLQGDNTLEEVTITAIAKTRHPVPHATERQVIAEIKSASLVASGISSEQISKSADRNAAEAVSKVAGVSVVDDKFVIVRGLNPRYNLTYLNDNVAPSTEVYSRAFALDLIPTRIIDRILVYKSAGPETLADATGGVVKIYTKDAKAVKHFDIELQLGHRQGTTLNKDFLTYEGGKTDWLGFDDGTRKLPSSVPGYDRLDLAQLMPSQYASSFNPTLTHQVMTALPNMQLTANYYNAFRVWGKTFSTLTSLSYKNEYQKNNLHQQEAYLEAAGSNHQDRIRFDDRYTQTAQLNLLQNFTYRLRDSSTLSFKNFVLQQGQDATISRLSYPTARNNWGNNLYNKDNILSFSQRFLYAGNLGGTHYYEQGRHKIQWNGGYTFSRQSTPDLRTIRFTAPGADYGLAVGDPSLQWIARGFNPTSSEADQPIPLALGIISRMWMRNSEGNYNASIDYTYEWKPWLSLRLGTFQQWKERQLYRRVYTVHEGDLNPNSGLGQGSHWIDPELVRFREQELANVWSADYFRDDYSGLKVEDRTSGSDSYLGTEQNNAGYLAAHFTPLDRSFEVYGGLRYEYNRQKIGAAVPPRVKNGNFINEPIYIDNPMRTWLPSVNASWRPSESWVVRAAYGKTVNRTEFREVAPYQELDLLNNVQISGNTNLISATVDNYDFRVEFYPAGNAKGETISAGVFYKELTNPIERINTSQRVLDYFPSISFQNASSATIRGVEIELNKKLDFIPGKLFRDLSLIANASFIKSEAVTDTTSATSLSFTEGKRPLQGQSPYIINAGIYYDNAAWGTRVAAIYNTRGENIYAVGRGYRESFFGGPEYRGGLIELPRHLLDLSVTQRIVGAVQLKLSVQNLLDAPLRIAEDFNFTNKYETLHDTGETNEQGRQIMDGDNISSSFRPGRHVVLNLSYSF